MFCATGLFSLFYSVEIAPWPYYSAQLILFYVVGNQLYLIRNNIISIKILRFLIHGIVMKSSPVHRKKIQFRDKIHRFVTVMGRNALKEAVPLERNKALYCCYLHAHILRPCYFTHERLRRLSGSHTHCPSLSSSHATVSSTHRCFCVKQRDIIITDIPNTGLLAASDEWYKYTTELLSDL